MITLECKLGELQLFCKKCFSKLSRKGRIRGGGWEIVAGKLVSDEAIELCLAARPKVLPLKQVASFACSKASTHCFDVAFAVADEPLLEVS